ncbi:TRAP transporter small permease [Alkalihalobacillus oceani]|uniref:TRAP transporter small permease n=1 Tax=Halalkalibacter oceani TaxID=1653776 RepID=UPI00203A73E6|nr:TRAP transporter small permease [Halalkalibacter oceani]
MSKKKQIGARLVDQIMRAIDTFSNVLMVGLTLVVFAEVLSRYIFNFPIKITGELTQLIFPWLVFMTTIAVTRNDDHLAIHYFRNKLKKGLQKIVVVSMKAIMLFFTIFMFISSYELAQAVINQPMPVLRISKAWLYSSLTVAFLGVSIIILYQIIMIILDKETWAKGELQ